MVRFTYIALLFVVIATCGLNEEAEAYALATSPRATSGISSQRCSVNRATTPSTSTSRLSSSTDENNGVAAQLVGPSDDDNIDEDEASKKETARLCVERNLPLSKVKNARDLASVRNSPVKPGKVFRMGRPGDATEDDQRMLFEEIGLKTLVDLRSPTELKDDPALSSDVFNSFVDMVWIENGRTKDGCLKELKDGETVVSRRRFGRGDSGSHNDKEEKASEDEMCEYDCSDPDSLPAPAMLEKTAGRNERHFVSLMNEFKYVRGTVSRVRKRDVARSILKAPGAIVSKRVWNSLKRPFIREINDGGLVMLNELLLRFGAPGIKYVLDLCADENRHPVGFYCTAGKDRTGMIAAIILSLLGASPEDIVEDYALSANVYAEMNDHQAMVGALSQRSLDPKTFLGAPPEVMRDVLVAIEENYGSVEGYCDWIGFGPEKREQLRKVLSKE